MSSALICAGLIFFSLVLVPSLAGRETASDQAPVPASPKIFRFVVAVPPSDELAVGQGPSLDVSSDGGTSGLPANGLVCRQSVGILFATHTQRY